ncbi:MAG: hypothetical protein HY906_18765 [Deltaproteobacteria bacterium]|nr:hypothetical protein [Deltaproteobacteria bacterium]
MGGSGVRAWGVVAVLVGCALAGRADAQGGEASLKPPPEELARFYPPKAKGKVYTTEMLELGRLLGATVSQAVSGHHEAALEEAAAFKAQYRKTAGMVGAWNRQFPVGPVDRLQQALAKKADRDTVRAAAARVEEVCTSCHVREMFRVQVRYHWGKFSAVTVAHSGRQISFHESMTELSNLMAGIGVHAARGQFDAAAREAAQLPQVFGALESSCKSCHAEKREYFVDGRAKGRMLRLAGLVRQKVRDRAQYDDAVNEINARSCIPCHQVHMPAAFLQAHWEKTEKKK